MLSNKKILFNHAKGMDRAAGGYTLGLGGWVLKRVGGVKVSYWAYCLLGCIYNNFTR